MSPQPSLKGLKIFLNVYGVISVLLFGGLFILTVINAPILQEGGALRMMRWEPLAPLIELMLLGIYFVWAIFFFLAAKNPLGYLSFIDFTIWANAVHGLIMLVEAIAIPKFHYKIFSDIAWCLVLAAGLLILRPRGKAEDRLSAAA